MKNADLNAFVDLRNLIFDREIGTNILTDLITGKDEDSQDLIILMKTVKEQLGPIIPDILEVLINVPDN